MNTACTSQSLVVPDLYEGHEYLFRIRAENRFGFSPFVETVEGTKARDPIRMTLCFYVRHVDANRGSFFTSETD